MTVVNFNRPQEHCATRPLKENNGAGKTRTGRRSDIEHGEDAARAAKERAALLIKENDGAGEKQRILNHALVNPSVTDSEYRVLSLELKSDYGTGKGVFTDPANSALVLGRSLRSYRRSLEGLEAKGWCSRKRRRDKTSIRHYTVPENILRASLELAELIPEMRQERPNLSVLTGERIGEGDRERPNLSARTAKSGTRIPKKGIPEEEEKNTRTREKACKGLALQGKVAAPGPLVPDVEAKAALQGEASRLVLDLATVEAIREDADRWGRKVGDPHFNPLPAQTVERELATLIGQSQHCSAETIKLAIAEAHNELLNMLDSGKVEPGAGWKAGLGYYRKVFRSARDRLHSAAQERSLAEQTAKEIAAEKINRERIVTQKTGAAFDRAAEAKAKRLEALPAKMNGRAVPSQPDTGGTGRTAIIGGKVRYNPGCRLVYAFGNAIALGEDGNKLADEMEALGASFEDVDAAFGRQNGLRNGKPMAREDVLKAVRKDIERELEKRRGLALKAKFGTPEKLCGGTPHPAFTSEMVCVSRETVAAIFARCPDVDYLAESIFREIISAGGYGDYGTGMQARIEAALEKRMLAAQEDAVKARELSLGVERIDGRVSLTRELSQEAQRIAGVHAGMLGDAWKKIKDKLYDRPAAWIREKWLRLAEMLKYYTCDEAVNVAFAEVFEGGAA
jgi:hypothetical protein